VILSFRLVDSVCHAASRFYSSSSKAFTSKNRRKYDLYGVSFVFVEKLTAVVFKAKDTCSTKVPNGV
jgi:hypothetical protein